jgi:hypothetical protein
MPTVTGTVCPAAPWTVSPIAAKCAVLTAKTSTSEYWSFWLMSVGALALPAPSGATWTASPVFQASLVTFSATGNLTVWPGLSGLLKVQTAWPPAV